MKGYCRRRHRSTPTTPAPGCGNTDGCSCRRSPLTRPRLRRRSRSSCQRPWITGAEEGDEVEGADHPGDGAEQSEEGGGGGGDGDDREERGGLALHAHELFVECFLHRVGGTLGLFDQLGENRPGGVVDAVGQLGRFGPVAGAEGGEDGGDEGFAGLAVADEAEKLDDADEGGEEGEGEDGPDPDAAFADVVEEAAADVFEGAGFAGGHIDGHHRFAAAKEGAHGVVSTRPEAGQLGSLDEGYITGLLVTGKPDRRSGGRKLAFQNRAGGGSHLARGGRSAE